MDKIYRVTLHKGMGKHREETVITVRAQRVTINEADGYLGFFDLNGDLISAFNNWDYFESFATAQEKQ